MVSSRKRRGLARIEVLIAQFNTSELSKAEFPGRVGVNPLSIDRWLRITHPTHPPLYNDDYYSQGEE
jgi:hypothetical protein